MRTAYSGRAAAYEKKGDYEKALADHKMAVLYYAIEAEILNNLQTPDRAKLLAECANAYRARSKCLEVLGKLKEAEQDRKWAEGIKADAKKLEGPALAGSDKADGIQVINTWTQPVTLVIGGTSHRLNIGERKTFPASTGSVQYEMQAGVYRAAGTFEVGKTYTIRPTP